MHSHNYRRALTLVASLFILATVLACAAGNTIQRLTNTQNVPAPTATPLRAPTQAVPPTLTVASTPTPIPTLDIVQSLSESALLKTEDLTFGGDHPAEDWRHCPYSSWILFPGNVTQLARVSGTWSFETCEDGDIRITENIIVLENSRHTERVATSILDTSVPAWTVDDHYAYLSSSTEQGLPVAVYWLVVVLDEANTIVALEVTHYTNVILVTRDLQEISEMALDRLKVSLNQR